LISVADRNSPIHPVLAVAVAGCSTSTSPVEERGLTGRHAVQALFKPVQHQH